MDFNGIAKGYLNTLYPRGLFDFPDPSKKGNQYYDQIPGNIHQYLDPYAQQGMGIFNNLNNQYNGMVQNPNDILNKIGAGYQQSPGFQFQLNQGQQAIGNAAAAGGMAGSNQHQQQSGELANNLANQDYNNYLKNALGIYGEGLQGQSNLNQMGYGANESLAQALSQYLMNQGNMNFQNQADKNKQKSGFLGSLIGGIGSLFG